MEELIILFVVAALMSASFGVGTVIGKTDACKAAPKFIGIIDNGPIPSAGD